MEKSIYQLICDNYVDGALSESFTLPAGDSGAAALCFAPGAGDGITIYHSARSSLNSLQIKLMAQALESASEGDYEEADELFYRLTGEKRAISLIDELQRYVDSHTDELDMEELFYASHYLITESTHTECVKIGLSIMELYGISDEGVREVIRRLGSYDEFTIFAIWNIRKWETGNQEIFELAKKVHSWGRIHAVERLEP